MAVRCNIQLAVLFVTFLLAMQIASGSEMIPGLIDSNVATPKKEPITISNSANSQIVQFDDLPREIQQQVVDALHQQQTVKEQHVVNKLEQQQDHHQLSGPTHAIKDQSVVVFEVEKQPAVQGSGNVDNTHPAKDELQLTGEQQGQLAMMLLQEQDVLQQIQQQQEEEEKDGQQLNDPAVSSGPLVVDSNQLPPEVRHEIMRQFNEQYQRAQHAQLRDGQKVQDDGQSDEEMAQVLTRMAIDDGNGNHFVDMDALSEEFRARVNEYLIRQQLDKEGKEEDRQQVKQTSSADSDKQSGSQLGGILGSLIGGAVGGYPTQGSYGYPQQSGYPGGGYPQSSGYPAGYPGGYPQQGGYPIGGYPSGGYPGGGYPGGGYPGGGYPGGGYPGGGYPGGGYPSTGYPGGGYPQQAGYPAGYPGSGYPQQGGYPGGQHGSTSGNGPNRPLGSGYGRPYWGFTVPQHQGQKRPYGILVTREQLSAMMSGSAPMMDYGQVVVAQPSFIGQAKPQDPFAAIYHQLYQQSQLNIGQQTPLKYGRYHALPVVTQQHKQHLKHHQLFPQDVGNRYLH